MPILGNNGGYFGSSGGTATAQPSLLGGTTPYKLPGAWGQMGPLIDQGLGAYQTEAFNVRDQENAAGARQEEYLRSHPSMSQAQIDAMYQSQSSQASKAFRSNMGGLRDYMGSSGVTGGGLPAGMAAQFAMARRGSLIDAKRSLLVDKAVSDAKDNSMIAQSIGRSPSTAGVDALASILQTRLGEMGISADYEAAKAQAKATKDAGNKSMIGGIIGSIGGVLGGIL